MKFRKSPSEITIFDNTPLVYEHTGRAEGERVLHSNTTRSMSSLVPGFEYDIFISYRQKDNLPAGGFGHSSGYKWVSEFVAALRTELNSILKEEVTIYFDENPHDGLLESHHVDKSLEGKLRCLIFLPILSHTYCDPRSYAWSNELLVFCRQANDDHFGLDIRLPNGNVASRILPVQIHDLDPADQRLFETTTSNPLRSVEFIYASPGVNRPLTPMDNKGDNFHKTYYRDQINKTANAIASLLKVMTGTSHAPVARQKETVEPKVDARPEPAGFWTELIRRNVLRAGFSYLVISLLIYQVGLYLTPVLRIEDRTMSAALLLMLLGLPVAMVLAWFYELSPYGIIRTDDPLSLSNPYPPQRKKPLTQGTMLTALFGVLLLQLIYYHFIRPQPVQPEVDANGNSRISIAVLPFENRSPDIADKYIADGLTDDIINRLTVVHQLRVELHPNVQVYQGNALPVEEIARQLQVMTILTGSVQRHERDIIIRARLIDARTSEYLWGNTFYRTMDNIVGMQAELPRIVVDQLKIRLSTLEKTRLNLVETDNATAYDHYLRGRSLYYKYSPASNDSAIQEFKKAISLDAKYSRAWAGLGDAYSQMNMRFGRGISWLDSSVACGKAAIQLDSTKLYKGGSPEAARYLSESYKALANAYSYKKQYTRAFPLLVKAVRLDPSNERAVGNLGTNYMLRNDLANALKWEKKAVGMNPKNWIPYQIVGWTYRLLGDLPQAESWFTKCIELKPTIWDTYELLAYTYIGQGRSDEAIKLVPKVLEIDKEDPRVLEKAALISHYAGDKERARLFYQMSIDKNDSYKDDPNTLSPLGLGQLLLEEGRRVDADVYLTHFMNMMQQEIDNGSESYEPRIFISAVYAIRGNRALSLEWLQKAVDAGWMDHMQVTQGPFFKTYRNDTEFGRYIQQVKVKSATMLKNSD